MTSGSSILAIILTALPQRLQIVISILNTRLSRCAQVISLCSSAGDSFGKRTFLSAASQQKYRFQRRYVSRRECHV